MKIDISIGYFKEEEKVIEAMHTFKALGKIVPKCERKGDS